MLSETLTTKGKGIYLYNMGLKNVLRELNLTDKESSVYLALLEIGQSSVLQLAKKSTIKRPTVYTTLDSLLGKGLVLTIPKGHNTIYQAINPDDFLKKFEKKIEVFKKILPELRSISNATPTKPKVRFYEGKKNILDLYENEIFKANKIYGITSVKALDKLFSTKEVSILLKVLKSHKGTIDDLLENSDESSKYTNEKNQLGIGETRFLPENFKLDVDLLIYNNSIALTSTKTLMAVVITDDAINKLQYMFFETLWNMSGRTTE